MEEYPIIIVKLTNGEQIMGELRGENDRCIDVDGCLMVELKHNFSGVPIIFMKKYCPWNDSFMVRIEHDFIMNRFSDPNPMVLDFYYKQLENQRNMYKDLNINMNINNDNAPKHDIDIVNEMLQRMMKDDKDIH